MIRTLTVGAIAFGLAASAAQAQAQAQPMGPPPGAMGGPMMGGAMPTPMFIRSAAQSDEFEIAAAHMALMRSHNPHVRMFAQRMIQDHSQSTMMIETAIRRSGHVPPPRPALKPEQAQMLDALRAAGPDFDRAYVGQMGQSHEMALALQQGYASGGTDPALRHAAGMIVPVVQGHLAMAREMQARMG